MARNLVQEKKEEKAPEEKPSEPQASPPQEMQVITTEQLLLNNLDAVMQELFSVKALVFEMAKQVGVVFPEKK